MERELKVFLGLVNYGTQAGNIALLLRQKGIYAISHTYIDKFQRRTDCTIQTPESSSFLKSVFFEIKILPKKLLWFLKFNTFHFFFGKSLLPFNFDLPFYRLFGKKVIMEYLGNDCQLYNKSVDKYKWTNMSAMFTEKEGKKLDNYLIRRLKWNDLWCTKSIVCAPLYSEFVKNSEILPLYVPPIELKNNSLKDNQSEKIKFLHAPTDKDFKGTGYILKAFERLNIEGYNAELLIVENISHSELLAEYNNCDVFIDQILAGWYGTATIEAMALGKPVIAYIRKSYTDDYKPPIINANPDNIYDVLCKICRAQKDELQALGELSKSYYEKVHSGSSVYEKLMKLYR